MNKSLIFLLLLTVMASCGVKEKKNTQRRTVKILSSPSQAPSGEPYLFTDKMGTTYLSWVEGDKSKSTLKYSILSNEQWSLPVAIDSGTNWFVNWADYPMMATNGQAFIANYLEKSGESTYAYDVMLTSSGDNGKIWSEPAVLHDDGKQAEHGFVSMVSYEEGFFVSWLDGRNTAMEGMEHHDGHHGEMSVRAAILDKNGKKISEWELDKRVCDCCQTSAAITSNGPIVVYRDRSDQEVRDMSIVRLINGQWTAPKSINNDNWKIEGCPVNGPRVAAQGNSLAIAWFSMPEGEGQVNLIFSPDGGATFINPIRVDEGNAIGRVDVVLINDKSAMVSWMEGNMIKAIRVNTDGSKETPIVIASSSDSRSSGFPQMTKSKDQLIFAWTDDKDKIVKVATVTL